MRILNNKLKIMNELNKEQETTQNTAPALGMSLCCTLLVVCWMCKGSGNIDEHEQEYCSIRHVTIEKDDVPFICDDYQPCR